VSEEPRRGQIALATDVAGAVRRGSGRTAPLLRRKPVSNNKMISIRSNTSP
jgi:hypothetical protein